MAERPLYSYSPLPSEHIRLLQIAAADEDILCSLTSIPLNNHPEFHAISYCWGSESPTSEIICDGASLKVTPHLREGLRCLFVSGGSTRFWVDAICINQSDDAEKASQVARMWNIYSTASKVLVWLGPEKDKSDAAIDAIPQLCVNLAKVPEGLGYSVDLKSFGLPGRRDPLWSAVDHIYLRPWFRRLWVVQEAVLAQDLYVMCGTKQLKWDQIHTLSEQIRKYSLPVNWRKEESRGIMELIGNINRARKLSVNGYVPAALLLHLSRSQLTKEPIDHVYGILGLFSAETRKEIKVDYSPESRAHYWRAFIQLFKSLLIDQGPKMLINLASETRHPAIPSWCPDLSSDGGTVTIPHVGYSSAGQPHAHRLNIEMITAEPDSDVMLIPGIKTDTVLETTELTDIWYWDGTLEDIQRRCNATLDADARCWEIIERMQPRFNVSKAQYARALIANQDWTKLCEYPQDRLEMDYDSAIEWIRSTASYDESSGKKSQRTPAYRSSMRHVCDGRNFFSTEKGLIGVGPRTTRPGDHVCVIFSGYCPWIMRSEPGASTYRILGDAYVEGLMKGEVYDLFDIEKDGYETFKIV